MSTLHDMVYVMIDFEYRSRYARDMTPLNTTFHVLVVVVVRVAKTKETGGRKGM